MFVHICVYLCAFVVQSQTEHKSYLTLCDLVNCSPPGIPVLHHTQSLLKLIPLSQ